MPALLGAGSEFIPNEKLEYYENEVLKLDELNEDTTFAGYIYGGINSSAPNIFFINDGTQSSASNQIFKVSIIKNSPVGIDELNVQSVGDFMMQVYPNPNEGEFIVRFNRAKQNDVQILIYNMKGQLITKELLTGLSTGMNEHRVRLLNLKNGGTFLVNIQSGKFKAVQKVIIN
ncbi:MAG: T9SS type A sorting domain-containing protein [Mariniphaga sp.]|nr:T9SS type A sorting domain-containing protein [Mariniphaga sp.]